MALQGITIHIDPIHLSDLFFNFDHTEYNNDSNIDTENDEDDAEAVARALHRDAMDFAGMLGLQGEDQVNLADDLCLDFWKRV